MAQLDVHGRGEGAWSGGGLRHLLERALAARRARRDRRIVAALDEAQLRDAGIDRTAAGRGKAVAVDPIVAFTLRAMGDQR